MGRLAPFLIVVLKAALKRRFSLAAADEGVA